MISVRLVPGQVGLAEWKTIYRGAEVSLDPRTAPQIAASAAFQVVRSACGLRPGGE